VGLFYNNNRKRTLSQIYNSIP